MTCAVLGFQHTFLQLYIENCFQLENDEFSGQNRFLFALLWIKRRSLIETDVSKKLSKEVYHTYYLSYVTVGSLIQAKLLGNNMMCNHWYNGNINILIFILLIISSILVFYSHIKCISLKLMAAYIPLGTICILFFFSISVGLRLQVMVLSLLCPVSIKKRYYLWSIETLQAKGYGWEVVGFWKIL